VASTVISTLEATDDDRLREACVHALCKCASQDQEGGQEALIEKGALKAAAVHISSSKPDIQVLALLCSAWLLSGPPFQSAEHVLSRCNRCMARAAQAERTYDKQPRSACRSASSCF
jgi:hypothetical protein